MKLSNRLKQERQIRGYSRPYLKKMLEETANINVTITTIRNWEENISEIGPESIAAISNLYDISIDNLVDENAEVQVNIDAEYLELGKSIHEWCQVTDITSFLQRFQIFDKSKWIPSPKYDLIMRLYSLDLNNSCENPYQYEQAYDVCDTWIRNFYKITSDTNNGKIENNFYIDTAGHLDLDDNREPIGYLETFKEINHLQNDIASFLEPYENCEMEVNRWKYLEK
ncbi:helix-turn-helix transcriptional regulator [Companilactobacillus mishanensis]|uniref:Helix-turn-helix transcriptional regulator n=1 Tax=Companilactobacillus mishanensis TaxID=2486008 RepID=A0A5P0ZHY5_9LACO|nr:helix-turn-helix transcriptional regulator [Companilactobacillus mishanensis]MQS52681.1 helix-turn-helix transcriptional regulator [Companilactobacillus mishanensis]